MADDAKPGPPPDECARMVLSVLEEKKPKPCNQKDLESATGLEAGSILQGISALSRACKITKHVHAQTNLLYIALASTQEQEILNLYGTRSSCPPLQPFFMSLGSFDLAPAASVSVPAVFCVSVSLCLCLFVSLCLCVSVCPFPPLSLSLVLLGLTVA